MNFYDDLVMQTQMNYSRHYHIYASGGTPYQLTDKKPLPYSEQIHRLVQEVKEADCVVVGGASGLSAAGGGDFYYEDNDSYRKYFRPFAEKYHFKGAFAGMMHPWKTREEYWGYLATFLHTTQTAPVRHSSYGEQWGYYSQYIRFMWEAPTGKPYLDLQALVADKPAFVLTTNVDQQFFRVFPQKQICAFQGDFSYCQCSQPCRDDIGENRELVKELTGCLAGVRLPEEAVPRCPDCGRVLVPWVRDDTFLEGTFWQDNLHRYHRFLRRWIMDQSDKKVLLLELGVGEMTPSIIKLPFWELTAKNENVFYACLNREASHRPEHLRGRSLYLQGDLAETLAALRQERSIAATIK